MQLDVAEAIGQARMLQPGESLEVDVAFVAFSGLDGVTEIQRRGDGFVVR